MAAPQPQPEPEPAGRAEDLSGATVGRFLIQDCLGHGGMGQVYRADDPRLKRRVALKRLAPHLRDDPRYHQRFLHEAERASALNHQNIAGVYDVLEDQGELFLVMEYVQGLSLRQRLSGPMPLPDFLDVAEQCAQALAAAHEKGVVHCDLKPENIMVTHEGQVKVLDFGVAKLLPVVADATAPTLSFDTRPGSLGGTVAYTAPEVLLERPPEPRADIFSLGVVFYEALTGRHPFMDRSQVATVDRILHENPPPLTATNPHLPPALEGVLTRMLAKDPAARYASAVDLLTDLRTLRHQPHRLPAPQPPARWRRMALPSVFLLLIFSVWLVWPPLANHPPGSAIPASKHLAVLPFQVIGDSGADRALSDGLTQTLTANLALLSASRDLHVAPASEARLAGSAREARHNLGVNLVLEGSFHRSQDAVRVTYSLVDPQDSRVLRAGTVTAPAADPFTLEDRVVEAVLSTLEIELEPPQRRQFAARGTTEPGAYELYLRGRGYLQDYHKPENIESAIEAFRQALELDARYAPAYAGLGDAYWYLYLNTSSSDAAAHARQSCARALQLDAALAAGHSCLGRIFNGTGEHAKAAEQFQRVLETEPTNDDAYRELAMAYEHLGKLQEAEATYRRAIALRPRYWSSYNWLGAFYYVQGHYQEAGQMFSRVVELAPDHFRGYSNLGGTYLAMGQYQEAIAALERSIAIRPTRPAYSNLGAAYFNLKRFPEAARYFQNAVDADPLNPIVWGSLAEANYWIPGQRRRSLELYRKALELAQEKLKGQPKDGSLLSFMALYHAALGEAEPALRRLEQSLQLAGSRADVQFRAASVHMYLGQRDQALQWIAKAAHSGEALLEFRNNPLFDPLRDDPQFRRLLQSAASAVPAR